MASLPLITSLARAGALDQAWRLFGESGLAGRTDDPAVLAVRGRLLKDCGLRLEGQPRREKLVEAAAAYAAADAIDPQPYRAINVATLRLLSGDPDGAAQAARGVLARLDGPEPIAETPYWLEATRAEALLLLGSPDEAATALARARAASPANWSDQASTVRQLGLIIAALGMPAAWLDTHRPPRALHYAGHLGVPSEAPELLTQIQAYLQREQIGFGYGALAAGADIVIAEALIMAGAELHVVLPVNRSDFERQSVAPFGADWSGRYQACLAAAASVREMTGLSRDYEPKATALAADIAMGSAALQARLMESEALQLLIVDDTGLASQTALQGEIWRASGRRQNRLTAQRAPSAPRPDTQATGRNDLRLLALLAVDFAGVDQLDEGAFAAQLDGWLRSCWSHLETAGPMADKIQPLGNSRLFAFAQPNAALHFTQLARQICATAPFPVTITGHYGLVHDVNGILCGSALARMEAFVAATLPGSVTISAALASAFAILSVETLSLETVGELQGETLFALQ